MIALTPTPDLKRPFRRIVNLTAQNDRSVHPVGRLGSRFDTVLRGDALCAPHCSRKMNAALKAALKASPRRHKIAAGGLLCCNAG
jgi:hypothetical protein